MQLDARAEPFLSFALPLGLLTLELRPRVGYLTLNGREALVELMADVVDFTKQVVAAPLKELNSLLKGRTLRRYTNAHATSGRYGSRAPNLNGLVLSSAEEAGQTLDELWGTEFLALNQRDLIRDERKPSDLKYAAGNR